jgi:uncharacterized membrane protein
MNKIAYIASAVTAALILPAIAAAGPVAAPSDFKSEKCYGIVKAGKNDCQTLSNSCAGTSKKDNQRDAWVYLPTGVCDKVSGSSMTPQ